MLGAAEGKAPWPMVLQEPSHRATLGHGLALPTSRPEVKWRYDTKEEVESSVVVGERLVFSAGGKTAYALDRATGEKVWSFQTQGPVLSSGALAGGVFLVGSDDQHFYALAEATGEVLWKFRAGEFTGGATVDEEEGAVYVGSGDRKLYAYFLNGTSRFTFTAMEQICSTPALDEGRVYFGDDAGHFYSVSRATGQEVWKVTFDSGIRSPARLEADAIFVTIGDPDGSQSGEVVRLGYDGAVQWRSDCGVKKTKCDSCWTTPAVVGDVVVMGCGLDTRSRGFIWGLEKDSGKVRWKVAAGNDCQTSSPVVMGEGVVLGCIDGSLYGIRAADGVVQWTFSAGAGIWTTPALDEDGTIYIGSHDGHVYALSARAEKAEL